MNRNDHLLTQLLLFIIFRAGIVSYEYYQLQRQLNTLVNSNVLNLGSKHPDYIYIKYHIYKESMLQRKHEELEGKVRKRSFLSFYVKMH